MLADANSHTLKIASFVSWVHETGRTVAPDGQESGVDAWSRRAAAGVDHGGSGFDSAASTPRRSSRSRRHAANGNTAATAAAHEQVVNDLRKTVEQLQATVAAHREAMQRLEHERDQAQLQVVSQVQRGCWGGYRGDVLCLTLQLHSKPRWMKPTQGSLPCKLSLRKSRCAPTLTIIGATLSHSPLLHPPLTPTEQKTAADYKRATTAERQVIMDKLAQLQHRAESTQKEVERLQGREADSQGRLADAQAQAKARSAEADALQQQLEQQRRLRFVCRGSRSRRASPSHNSMLHQSLVCASLQHKASEEAAVSAGHGTVAGCNCSRPPSNHLPLAPTIRRTAAGRWSMQHLANL